VKKVFAKAMATAAFMGLAGFGVAACGSNPAYTDSGYEQVWDNGHYVYVPYSYYTSHRNLYSNRLHAPHHYTSSYVTSHHVTVTHQTTVHKNGSRTTTRTTTRHTTTTRRSSGFGSGSRSYRRH
jgi:hypothetical protein